MKKFLLMFLIACGAFGVNAKSLNVELGQLTYSFPADNVGDVKVVDGGLWLDINNMGFQVAEISRVYVVETDVADNTVNVTYDGELARVVIAGNIAPYVTVETKGAHIILGQDSRVSDATCGEITYQLAGESGRGSFTLTGSYKATVELGGLALTNPDGAALNIQNGKRINLRLADGSVNTLADGAGGTQKAALVCKGHLEFKGHGVLDVAGNCAHAIYAKEYVEVKNCTINVTGAQRDGINCAQYFAIESGEINISGVGDNGIQVDFKDATNREAIDSGSLTINGGNITITAAEAAAKGLKAAGPILTTGGTVDITVTGKGEWSSTDSKTKASACMSSDEAITVNGGTLTLKATGSGGKGISCDGGLTVEAGQLNVTTSGGIYAYVNGREYDGYTGNTDRLDSSAKSSPKGIKCDADITINGGSISVVTTGSGAEGIESKSMLTINDGNVKVRATDDTINSSSHMYIKGGTVDVISTGNDGLDSNGNLYIQGGYIMAFGAKSPECGLDANEEEGFTVIFTGGTLLAAGGGNSTPSTGESTAPYVSASGTLTAGSTVALKSGSEILASFVIPSDYTSVSSGSMGGGGRPGGMGGGSSILITCQGLTSGSSYTLANGSSTSTVTAALKGSSSGRPW